MDLERESIEKRIEEVYKKQKFFEINDAKYIWMMFFGFKVKKAKLLPFFENGRISKEKLVAYIIHYKSIAGNSFSKIFPQSI